MQSRTPFSACAIRVLVAAALLTTAAAQLPQPSRALPLNRFPVSRSNGTDARGYFQMAVAVGEDYFDGHDSAARVRRHMRLARALGVRYLRCAFSWNGIEPQRGQYQFAFWDMLVNEAARAHVQLLPYVAYTPRWAAVRDEKFWTQPPKDAAFFADMMRVLAARYRGRIHTWEFWNEPDNREYWAGSADEFGTMVKAAAEAVRTADPAAVLVLGGMSRPPGNFLDVLVANGVDRYVDVIAQHAYPESWDEERAESAFGRWIPEAKARAARAGADLWVNEMGYSDYRYDASHASVYGTNINYVYEHTRRYAADFLFKSLVMTLASGQVSVAGWYRLDDFADDDRRMSADKVNDHLGLTDVTHHPKPMFFALRYFGRLFAEPSRTIALRAQKMPGSQAEVRAFALQGGRVVVAAWLRSSNFSEVPAHSGMLSDRRSERVSVDLPCRAATVTTLDAMGKTRGRQHPFTPDLTMNLSGERVFVAEIACAKKRARDAVWHP